MANLAAGLGIAFMCATSGTVNAQAVDRVTVYSSLPLSGPSRPQSQAIVRGARLALEEVGSVAGRHHVRYVSLNDSSRAAGAWTPELTSRNARRAAGDSSAIAYIGEFNSGASAISIPMLNEVGIAQISPSNTAIGLTRRGLGAYRGEPGKYYPTARRSFFRLAQNDRVQGGALAAAMRDRGCERVALIHDRELYGRAVAGWTRRAARRLQIRVLEPRRMDPTATRYRRLARNVRRARADCVAYAGITANNAVRLFKDLARALPRAKLFGSDGIAESGFTDPRQGGVPPAVGRRVLITVNTLAPSAFPPQGQDFFRRYSARYGEPSPDPYAIYGYEAMRLMLDAVAVKGADREGVIDWLHAMPARDGALGRYEFDRYGDITLRTYGVYRVAGSALEWAGAVDAP